MNLVLLKRIRCGLWSRTRHDAGTDDSWHARCRVVLAVFFLVVSSGSQGVAYDITNRWTNTKTDGSGLQRGDAITLLWSVVPDGESWSRGGPSDLIDYLDVGWNVASANRVPDLTNRPWWSWMDRVYEQYERVSGLTLTYEAEQHPNGSDTGKSGDLRTGGVPFTWENDKGGVLADNAFPNNGDMRIDTYRGNNGVPSFWHTNPAAFRNLIAHESGHGVGLSHSDISGANAVMETPLETGFWGLQFDDVYAFNRLYGDPLEKDGGNDTFGLAYNLGRIDPGSMVTLGTDANDSSVSELDDDWLGIDGTSDEDWFSFFITDPASVEIAVRPQGPSYTTSEQGSFNGKARADLNFELYDTNGTTLLRAVDEFDIGSDEILDVFPLASAGTYYVRVDSEADLNQFYQLDVSVTNLNGIAGDVNQDGLLNSLDIDAFVLGWFTDTSSMTSTQAVMNGDLNVSGLTDMTDAILLHQALLNVGSALDFGLLTQIPEPSALMLLVLSNAILSLPRTIVRHTS